MVYKQYLIDSSVLIAFFNELDSCHQKAVKLITEINKKPNILHVHVLVLMETLTVLKQKVAFDEFSQYSKTLMNQEAFTLINGFFYYEDMPFNKIFFKKNKLSFIDSFLIDYSKSQKLPLLTFDQAIIKSLN